MDIKTSFYIRNGCFNAMISKVQVLAVVVVVSIHTSLTMRLREYYKTPIVTVKLHYRGFPGSVQDILPFAVIQRIQNAQNARVAHQMPSKDVQYETALNGEKHSQWQPVDFKRNKGTSVFSTHNKSMNSNHHNSSNAVTNSTSRRLQLRSERSQKNIRHFKLYDEDGEHLLDLKVDNNKRLDIEKLGLDTWKPTAIELTAMEDSTMAPAKRRRQTVLRPVQSSENVKRVRHYWLDI